MSRPPCRPGAAIAAVLALAACAPTPPPTVPPPPPPAPEPVPSGWRALAAPDDQDRYDRRAEAWRVALDQAGRLRGSGDLDSLGELIVETAQRPSVAPPPGDYRCRTVKLGSQSGDDGLGYVVYGWFACRVEAGPDGLRLIKRTGSQRPAGLLYPEDDRQMVFLGSMALADEAAAAPYGRNPDRDMIGVLERIGERRWRLVIPWPRNESNLDLIELVPAAR